MHGQHNTYSFVYEKFSELYLEKTSQKLTNCNNSPTAQEQERQDFKVLKKKPVYNSHELYKTIQCELNAYTNIKAVLLFDSPVDHRLFLNETVWSFLNKDEVGVIVNFAQEIVLTPNVACGKNNLLEFFQNGKTTVIVTDNTVDFSLCQPFNFSIPTFSCVVTISLSQQIGHESISTLIDSQNCDALINYDDVDKVDMLKYLIEGFKLLGPKAEKLIVIFLVIVYRNIIYPSLNCSCKGNSFKCTVKYVMFMLAGLKLQGFIKVTSSGSSRIKNGNNSSTKLITDIESNVYCLSDEELYNELCCLNVKLCYTFDHHDLTVN